MRRVVLTTAIVALVPLLVAFTWPGTVEWLCTRGIKQYEAGEFEEAGESFARALEADPGNATLTFNRGTALYRQQDFAEAAEAFASAAEGGGEEPGRDAAYNLGNSQFSAGDYQSAIEAYKQALRLDPDDAEAKYNLELALRKQEEQQQEQEQQEQQQEEDQPQEDEQEQQEQNEEQDSQERDEQQGDQPQSEQQDEPSPPGADEAEEGELTEAQAQRLLHALASQDAEMQKLIRRAPQRRQPSEGEKDW